MVMSSDPRERPSCPAFHTPGQVAGMIVEALGEARPALLDDAAAAGDRVTVVTASGQSFLVSVVEVPPVERRARRDVLGVHRPFRESGERARRARWGEL